MDVRYLRAACRGPRDASDPESPLRFVASTEDVGRDGLIIRQSGWELDNFKANPVILNLHNYDELPIGRAVDIKVEGKELIADVVFDTDDERGAALDRKYRGGFMHAVSVGWRTLESRDTDDDGKPLAHTEITRAELWEISTVPVPGDAGAVLKEGVQAALAGARQAVRELEEAVTGHAPEDEEPDLTELLSMTSRAGAVLSKRNKQLLTSARDAIQKVLDAAEKADEDDGTKDADDEDAGTTEAFAAIASRLDQMSLPIGDRQGDE